MVAGWLADAKNVIVENVENLKIQSIRVFFTSCIQKKKKNIYIVVQYTVLLSDVVSVSFFLVLGSCHLFLFFYNHVEKL